MSDLTSTVTLVNTTWAGLTRKVASMLIDCDSCAVRGEACGDCVVTVLLAPPRTVEWDADERRALQALADGGLLPRLRLAPMPAEPGSRPAGPRVAPGPVLPARAGGAQTQRRVG